MLGTASFQPSPLYLGIYITNVTFLARAISPRATPGGSAGQLQLVVHGLLTTDLYGRRITVGVNSSTQPCYGLVHDRPFLHESTNSIYFVNI